MPTTSFQRVGVGAAAGTYALLHTPSKPITGGTPAASTPENGSPSYESFQVGFVTNTRVDILTIANKVFKKRRPLIFEFSTNTLLSLTFLCLGVGISLKILNIVFIFCLKYT